MNTLKLKKISTAIALLGGMAWAGTGAAMQTFTPLPSPDCGTPGTFTQTNNCITFGDFDVFSLGLLYVQAAYASTGIIPTTNPNPGDPYYVKSSAGELALDGYIVYGTGAGGQNLVTNGDGTLIDNAQDQPQGGSPASQKTFVVGPGTETTPTFTDDLNTSWDATLSALRTELAAGSNPAGEFVIYFNLNETGTDGLLGLDLLTWFKITLEDMDGNLPTKEFYLTGVPGSTTAPLVPTADQMADPLYVYDPNWVYVHGTICVSATTGFLGFGPCTLAQAALGGTNVNQNLGANAAAFAIYNEELSDLVLDSGYDIMRGNWQFAYINNGPEQQFSALTPVGRQVPEPGTLALLGLGLMGLGLGSLRRHKAA